MTELFEVSTPLGLCTCCAIANRRPAGRRVLLVSINSRYPEVESWYRDNPVMQRLAERHFDEVIELNEQIFPTHPSRWWFEKGWASHERQWLQRVNSDRVDALYLESIQAPPSWSLAQLFSAAEIRIYSDGMMVYGPSRKSMPRSVAKRITEVNYVEFLDGVEPLLFDELRPQYRPIPMESLREFFAEIRPEASAKLPEGAVLFVGQAMANHRMMDEDQELAIYLRGLTTLGRVLGPERVLFKPHPSAPASLLRRVQSGFRSAVGGDLTLIQERVAIESLVDAKTTAAVAGVFSTALFTLRALYGIPAFSCGAKEVLYGLRPYPNSNRIPLVAADVALPSVDALAEALQEHGPEDLHTLARELDANPTSAGGSDRTAEFRDAQLIVGFHMQPKLLAHREADVEAARARAGVRYLDLYLVAAHDKSRNSLPQANGVAAKAGRVMEETARWLVRMSLSDRKIQKFERDPDLFFKDSKVLGAKSFGKALRALTPPSTTSEFGSQEP